MNQNQILTIEKLQGDRVVHVLPPVFPVSGDRDLPVGPFTGQVDADAGDDCGLVLQAERGEVEAVGGKTTEETPVSYSSRVGIQDISTSPGTWLKTLWKWFSNLSLGTPRCFTILLQP